LIRVLPNDAWRRLDARRRGYVVGWLDRVMATLSFAPMRRLTPLFVALGCLLLWSASFARSVTPQTAPAAASIDGGQYTDANSAASSSGRPARAWRSTIPTTTQFRPCTRCRPNGARTFFWWTGGAVSGGLRCASPIGGRRPWWNDCVVALGVDRRRRRALRPKPAGFPEHLIRGELG